MRPALINGRWARPVELPKLPKPIKAKVIHMGRLRPMEVSLHWFERATDNRQTMRRGFIQQYYRAMCDLVPTPLDVLLAKEEEVLLQEELEAA